MTLKRKFAVRGKQVLINRLIDGATNGWLSDFNFRLLLNDDHLAVMGVEVVENPMTLLEQDVKGAFSQRCSIASELAMTLKLIRSVAVPVKMPMKSGPDIETRQTRWVASRFGRIYRRLPSFLQVAVLWLATSTIRLTATLTKFKWLTGVISFAVLAAKVWHSGSIDKSWIGISAVSGFAVVWLLSLWR
jgi:hypothetical protein